MSLISLAIGKSTWRGYDYCKSGKVGLYTKVEEGIYTGKITGSGNAMYNVYIDATHPRRSKCNCPVADGTRKICKHMVALYFTVFPDELRQYELELEEAERAEQQEEERLLELEQRLIKHINGMSKKEMEDVLYDIFSHMIDEGNGWAVENFINGYSYNDYYDEYEEW